MWKIWYVIFRTDNNQQVASGVLRNAYTQKHNAQSRAKRYFEHINDALRKFEDRHFRYEYAVAQENPF